MQERDSEEMQERDSEGLKSNTVAISRGLYRNWNVKTGVFKWEKILYLKLGEQIAYTRNRNWRPRIRYIGGMIITNT